MINKSEDIKRLSIVIGAISSLAWLIFVLYSLFTDSLLIFRYMEKKLEFIIFGTSGIFMLSCGIVHIIYWIYLRFKMDITKK